MALFAPRSPETAREQPREEEAQVPEQPTRQLTQPERALLVQAALRQLDAEAKDTVKSAEEKKKAVEESRRLIQEALDSVKTEMGGQVCVGLEHLQREQQDYMDAYRKTLEIERGLGWLLERTKFEWREGSTATRVGMGVAGALGVFVLWKGIKAVGRWLGFANSKAGEAAQSSPGFFGKLFRYSLVAAVVGIGGVAGYNWLQKKYPGLFPVVAGVKQAMVLAQQAQDTVVGAAATAATAVGGVMEIVTDPEKRRVALAEADDVRRKALEQTERGAAAIRDRVSGRVVAGGGAGGAAGAEAEAEAEEAETTVSLRQCIVTGVALDAGRNAIREEIPFMWAHELLLLHSAVAERVGIDSVNRSSREVLTGVLLVPGVRAMKVQELLTVSSSEGGKEMLQRAMSSATLEQGQMLFFLAEVCRSQREKMTGLVSGGSREGESQLALEDLTLGEFLESTSQAARFLTAASEFMKDKDIEDIDPRALTEAAFNQSTGEFIRMVGDPSLRENLALLAGAWKDSFLGRFDKFCIFTAQKRQTLLGAVETLTAGENGMTDITHEDVLLFQDVLKGVRVFLTDPGTIQHLEQYTHGRGEFANILRGKMSNLNILDAMQLYAYLRMTMQDDRLEGNLRSASPVGAFLLQMKVLNLVSKHGQNREGYAMSNFLLFAWMKEGTALNLPPGTVELLLRTAEFAKEKFQEIVFDWLLDKMDMALISAGEFQKAFLTFDNLGTALGWMLDHKLITGSGVVLAMFLRRRIGVFGPAWQRYRPRYYLTKHWEIGQPGIYGLNGMTEAQIAQRYKVDMKTAAVIKQRVGADYDVLQRRGFARRWVFSKKLHADLFRDINVLRIIGDPDGGDGGIARGDPREIAAAYGVNLETAEAFRREAVDFDFAYRHRGLTGSAANFVRRRIPFMRDSVARAKALLKHFDRSAQEYRRAQRGGGATIEDEPGRPAETDAKTQAKAEATAQNSLPAISKPPERAETSPDAAMAASDGPAVVGQDIPMPEVPAVPEAAPAPAAPVRPEVTLGTTDGAHTGTQLQASEPEAERSGNAGSDATGTEAGGSRFAENIFARGYDAVSRPFVWTERTLRESIHGVITRILKSIRREGSVGAESTAGTALVAKSLTAANDHQEAIADIRDFQYGLRNDITSLERQIDAARDIGGAGRARALEKARQEKQGTLAILQGHEMRELRALVQKLRIAEQALEGDAGQEKVRSRRKAAEEQLRVLEEEIRAMTGPDTGGDGTAGAPLENIKSPDRDSGAAKPGRTDTGASVQTGSLLPDLTKLRDSSGLGSGGAGAGFETDAAATNQQTDGRVASEGETGVDADGERNINVRPK